MTIGSIILAIVLFALVYGSTIKEAWDIHFREIFKK